VPPGGPTPLARLLAHIRRIRKLRRLVLDLRPDVVLSFIDTSNVMTLMACVGLRRRVVVSERTNGAVTSTLPRIWRALRAVTYRSADVVITQTRDAARWVEGTCHVRPVVIPNPLRQLPDIKMPREAVVLAAGRLSHEKGFDILISAFAGIARDFPDWRLVILGVGPENVPLRSMCAALRVEARVEFLPPTKDIESWFARASLVVQPSRLEGFPNVILEAMGMGAAVISADCRSGPAEIIEDGVNGRLVPPEDPNRLAEVMAELMRDPNQRDRLGLEARRVRVTFAQDFIMQEWEHCILSEFA